MMKRAVYILISLLLATSACTFKPDAAAHFSLQEVEGMIHTAPDKAYYLLQNVLAGSLKTEADSAYYELLLAEAQLGNSVKLEDSLSIRHLADYYKAGQDTLKQARALRLYAATCRDLGCNDEVVQHYNAAIALAKEINNLRLQADAYYELGHVYYGRWMMNPQDSTAFLVDSLFYLTDRMAEALKDTALWIRSLKSHRFIFNGNRERAESERVLLSALHLSEKVGDKKQEAGAALSLSILYAKEGEKEKSFAYTQRNLSLRKGAISEAVYCFTLGAGYERIGEKDSADYYMKKGHELKRKEREVSFSTPSSASGQAAISNEQFAEQLKQAEDFERRDARKRNIYIGLTFLLIALAVFSFIYWRKRYLRVHAHTRMLLQQTEEQLQQEKEKLQHQEKQMNLMKRELEVLSSDTLSVYDKINRIVEDCLYKDRSELRMEEADWRQLQVEIDKQWNYAATQLEKEFRLTASEVHLLCLNLTDLPTAHIPLLFDRGRNTIYVKTRKLCEKLGVVRQSDTFKEDFKKFVENRK